MIKANANFSQLNESYLFSTIAGKVKAFRAKNPDAYLVSLGIGDVTRPICPAVVDAMVKCAKVLGTPEGFMGYGPEQGHEFLRELIKKNDYIDRGINIDTDEIFISDGAKSDLGNFTDLLSSDCVVGIPDPVYPVYLDTNVMDGRRVVFLPCMAENGFSPEIPTDGAVDVIYLCSPNNPTGTTLSRDKLTKWIEYAIRNRALILFDSAYEAFVSDADVPRSIYEIEGAEKCVVEFRSFSKTAGFTGLRCGYTVVPRGLTDAAGISFNNMWRRRQSTKFNGASYIVQRAAAALYSPKGQAEIKENIDYYKENSRMMLSGLQSVGVNAYGGINSPYVWMEIPGDIDSWTFFDTLLQECAVVVTPGKGFGPCGEGYVRLTSFNTHENTRIAIDRITSLLK